MKLLPTSALLLLLEACATLAHGGHDDGPKPVQLCAVNHKINQDACLALSSHTNATTNERDLRLHMSVRFFDERKGWASFAVGEHMDMSMMFIMYPGVEHDDVTISVRTTRDHMAPRFQHASPYVRVEKTWFDPLTETHNAQMICYTCERWKGQPLDLLSTKQKWIWATNRHQVTRSNDVALSLERHGDFGVAKVDMKASFAEHGEGVIPEVSANRVSTPKASVNWVLVHGVLLSGAFFVLTPGVLAIRSGLTRSFQIHWMVQAASSVAIFAGCVIGLKISLAHGTFASVHQLLGYTVPFAIVLQGIFGYSHHVNYKKVQRRTKISHYHIWLGRGLLVGGNFNIGLGLKLAGAHKKPYIIWIFSLLLQLAILVSIWYFSSKGKSILSSVKQGRKKDNSGYENVEQDAFIVGEDDVGDDFDDGDGDGGGGENESLKKEEI